MEATTDGDAAAHLLRILTRMQRQLTRALDGALAEIQLTADQWLLLRAVRSTDEATMRDLVRQVGLTPATATRAVDALVDAALVYRHTAHGDRRRVAVTLSDMGARHLRQADAIAASVAAALPEAWSGVRELAAVDADDAASDADADQAEAPTT